MLRFISLLLRKLQSSKHSKRLINNFQQWKDGLQSLPQYTSKGKKLLIIRLDDIGDYLLFRNMLPLYKEGRFKEYETTLLGNIAWKELFDVLDNKNIDKAVWMDKKQYLQDASYRHKFWMHLRNEGFEIVVCPSRTRPLLLDDICMLATGASIRIGSGNTFIDENWNKLSDELYSQLYQAGGERIHEFHFNLRFANWVCGTNKILDRPVISCSQTNSSEPYILCFIGASVKSKRWPDEQWIEFVKLYKQKYDNPVIIAGGKADVEAANNICTVAGAKSIAGTTTLKDMIAYVCNATAVVTNDTMSAHLAASCNKPAIIIANGNKYYRFTEYEKAGIQNIVSIYPRAFIKKLNNKRGILSEHYTAVTADIATIEAKDVFRKLSGLLKDN